MEGCVRRQAREGRKKLDRRMGKNKRSLFKRRHGPAGRCRVTGIAGAGRGTGVTHLSVLMANYLASSLQHRTAVLDWSGHGDLMSMACASGRKNEKNADAAVYGFRILGVTYYTQGSSDTLARCMEGGFEDIIIDFGEMRPSIRNEWLRSTVKIMAASLSEWKLEAFMELLTGEEECGAGWIYTAAFGSEDPRREIERQFGIPLRRVPLSVDAFSVDYRTMKWFEGIL